MEIAISFIADSTGSSVTDDDSLDAIITTFPQLLGLSVERIAQSIVFERVSNVETRIPTSYRDSIFRIIANFQLKIVSDEFLPICGCGILLDALDERHQVPLDERGESFLSRQAQPDFLITKFSDELVANSDMEPCCTHPSLPDLPLKFTHEIINGVVMVCGDIRSVVSQSKTFIGERPVADAAAKDHYAERSDGPMAPVTNEDYVGALVSFNNGAQGTLEVCRVIQGPQSEIGFHVHGRRGALAWEFERMNEYLLFRADDEPERGYRRVLVGPDHPFHGQFSPGAGIGLGYDDLKTIEAHQFLQSVATGEQAEPGLRQALRVAEVQSAMQRSWDSSRWENVEPLA